MPKEIYVPLPQLAYVTGLVSDLDAIRERDGTPASAYLVRGPFGLLFVRTHERVRDHGAIRFPNGPLRSPDSRERVQERLTADFEGGLVSLGGNGYVTRVLSRAGDPLVIG